MRIDNLQRLNREAIDDKTVEVLEKFDPTYFSSFKPTPINKLILYFQKSFNIPFELEAQLGFDDFGNRILGCYVPSKRHIYIDRALKDHTTKYNFVIAHELGHLVLHRNCLFEDLEDEPLKDHDYEIEGRRELKTDRDFMEWQANYFASCLLLPKIMLAGKVMKEKFKMGLRKHPVIYVDNQPCNQKTFYTLKEIIAAYFNVSKTVVEIRLKDLKLIDDRRSTGFKSIGDIIRESNPPWLNNS